MVVASGGYLGQHGRSGRRRGAARPKPRGSERGQILLPALLVFSALFLFVCLVRDTALLSADKIRHQFAVDTAAFAVMTNYSKLLNRAAFVNGAFPFHLYWEFTRMGSGQEGSPRCIGICGPGNYCVPAAGECQVPSTDGKHWGGDTLYKVWHDDGLFPGLAEYNKYDSDTAKTTYGTDTADHPQEWGLRFGDDRLYSAAWNSTSDPDMTTSCGRPRPSSPLNPNISETPNCLDVFAWPNFTRDPKQYMMDDAGCDTNDKTPPFPSPCRGRNYFAEYTGTQRKLGAILGKSYKNFYNGALPGGQLSFQLGYLCNLYGCQCSGASCAAASHDPGEGQSPVTLTNFWLQHFADPAAADFKPHCVEKASWYYDHMERDPLRHFPTLHIHMRGGLPSPQDIDDEDPPNDFLEQRCDLGTRRAYGLFRLVTIKDETLDGMRTDGEGKGELVATQHWTPPTRFFPLPDGSGGWETGPSGAETCSFPCVRATASLGTTPAYGSGSSTSRHYAKLWPDPMSKFQAEIFP